ncbi:metallophosphoesterase [Rhizobium leguminosarum]|uniref:metallophosphoesterase n=1 Tax=Rhizobium leguminosarum TaxID=384 RepID=UPI00103F5B1B|nr:metallophosphoesterase [Rhizobium leguminosarum]TCA03824.1 phosphohydrolase [Rhizobium leguminosarum bv. viciae]
MRAWIISDIHHARLDALLGKNLLVPKADVCICAGDITNSVADSISYVRRSIEPHMPVVLTLGNHDYYGVSIDFALDRARHLVRNTRITLLENQTAIMNDCRFIGATLWTDFAVSVGDDEHIPPEERRGLALSVVPASIADFFEIFRSDERQGNENGMVTTNEILSRHRFSRSFIDQALGISFSGRTVVLTHHAPHMNSLDPRFFGQATSAAFVSDLSDLIERRRPDVWIHGHVHRFRDYMASKTRVICNPHGYGGERGTTGFRPGFVIDL